MPRSVQAILRSNQSPLKGITVTFAGTDAPADLSPLRKRTPQRDSLRSRMSPGLIGDIEAEKVDLEEFEPEFSSEFDKLCTEAEAREAFSPFVDVTEDRERHLLAELRAAVRTSAALREKSSHTPLTSEKCYRRIDRNIRDALKRYRGVYLAELEQQLLDFVATGSTADISAPHSMADGALVIAFDNSFSRLLCHAICQYHAIACHSRELPRGGRATVIMRPKLRHAHTPSALAEYLSARRGA